MAFFKTLFGRKETLKEEEPDNSANDPVARIQALQKSHAFIDVKTPHRQDSYQSMVLELDLEQEEMIIDGLFPNEQLENLVSGDSLEIISRSEQHPLQFFSRLLRQELLDGNRVCRLELPRYLADYQNRGAYRVYVDREEDLDIDLGSPSEGEGSEDLAFAHIINLSAEGLKLSFDRDLEGIIEPGDRFEQAIINLPNGHMIDCVIELRNLYRIHTPRPHSLAGGSLKIDNPQQRNKLSQYLASVQRQQARRENRSL